MAVTKLLFSVDEPLSSLTSLIGLTAGVSFLWLAYLVVYNIYFHPLAQYPGPWYAKVTSLSLATISWCKAEPQWLQAAVKRYGSEFSDGYGCYFDTGHTIKLTSTSQATPQYVSHLRCYCFLNRPL
jgi:hypothetical protein